MKYYIGDLHLGHFNIIRMDGRPFASSDEMDKTIIENWNSTVTDNDDVYILGDLAYRGENPSYYLSQLKGKKHLIIGNHDEKWANRKSRDYDRDAIGYLASHEMMTTVWDTLNGEKVQIKLCHYPLAEWDGFFRDAYHIYGHIHNNLNDAYYFMKRYDKALNSAVCINQYKPCTLSELIVNNKKFKDMNKGEFVLNLR